MNQIEKRKLAAEILLMATEFGASLVGIANVEELKKAPSFTVAPKMPEYNGVGAREEKIHTQKSGEVGWPEGAQSVIVVAYAHPEDQPELDYWHGKANPPGNTKLISIISQLKEWLKSAYDIDPIHLPYHIEKGGIYLKDAAVLAGLGCIGKNNLLLTPEYGARVRLRAMTINIELLSTGPVKFDPCAVCSEHCIKACPQRAFDKELYTPLEYGRKELPGRKGNYNRLACNVQMNLDENSAEVQVVKESVHPVKVTKYCRCCELSCPVGTVSDTRVKG